LSSAELKEASKMRKIIYTCITGGYERTHVPGYIADGWETVMFSDVPISHPGWMTNIIIPPEQRHADPRRTARKIKILSHQFLPDADVTFWMDANMQITCCLNTIEQRFLDRHDLATFKNPRRKCIYQEAIKVKDKQQDVPAIVDAQIARYQQEGYPLRNGLICSNIMMRRHSDAVKALNEMWWHELSTGSRRDQLSFNYCCWKLGFKYRCIETTHSSSLRFRYRRHGR
jgi:hypothetical protein